MTHPITSTKTLIVCSIWATVLAAIMVVTVILPAEYNIDPTKIGGMLGLTNLAQQQESSSVTSSQDEIEYTQEVIEVTVPAGKGIEYKFYVKQFHKMRYEWLTDGEPLYFDLHGEPEGDTTDYFESYAIATLSEMKGSFTAPFDGSHGWYRNNTSDKPVAVQLFVDGQFTVIGLKQ